MFSPQLGYERNMIHPHEQGIYNRFSTEKEQFGEIQIERAKKYV